MFMWKEIIMDEQLYPNSLQAICVLQPHIKANGDSLFLVFVFKRNVSKIFGIQGIKHFPFYQGLRGKEVFTVSISDLLSINDFFLFRIYLQFPFWKGGRGISSEHVWGLDLFFHGKWNS